MPHNNAITLPSTTFGEGLPVILLHAFPVDSRIWLHQAQALSSEYQVIVPDQRGFGQARDMLEDRLEGQALITIDQAADDVAQLLTTHKIEKAVIGGISRGGYIALAFARRHPDLLLGLMLFDTRATPADDKETNTYSTMADRITTEGLGFVPEEMKPRIFGPAALAQRPDLVRQVSEWILEQDPQSVAAAARGMVSRQDARPTLPAIKVPVLAVAGTEDGAYQNTKAIADAIEGAQFVDIPDAGHFCILERPEMTTEIMRAFLQSSFSEKAN